MSPPIEIQDLWAGSAALFSAAGFATRRHMLKREMTTWTSAPWPAQLSLFLIGLTMAIVGISILWGGYHANQRETVIYTVLAARSWVMVMNLDRHGRNWSVT